MGSLPATFSTQLRRWRQRRRLSQLALALEADISQRHVSFLEAGKAQPSRGMVLRLAEALALPLRESNALLVAADFAPIYRQRRLDAPELAAARGAIDAILTGQMPHPALAVDRYWNLLLANRAVHRLLDGLPEQLLSAPLNVMRLSLHPEGLAPRILNLREWRGHLLSRLAHEVELSADPDLAALLDEVSAYPGGGEHAAPDDEEHPATAVAVPLRLASEAGPLSFISTTTVFGTAVEVTLAEVTIEALLPADEHTAQAMRRLAAES